MPKYRIYLSNGKDFTVTDELDNLTTDDKFLIIKSKDREVAINTAHILYVLELSENPTPQVRSINYI
ncbi:hypothetical protein SEA_MEGANTHEEKILLA_106 [Streptomyces phage MeganTheeKilla]|uniref:Uncharacterized protein n=1 Tax=Streptomyces phage MeganTheeKilla TaxID=2801897 RepID=A0A7U0GC64_9CAUD|nr:hypothetical protein SEA_MEGANTHEEKILLA_106 [Streptomyces phage MeganTheeKilla]